MSVKIIINTVPLTFEETVKLKALDILVRNHNPVHLDKVLKLLELNRCFSSNSVLFTEKETK
jgi:hypothetical protein